MIDIATEKLLSMKEATRYIPLRQGKRVSVTTPWRWATVGKNGILLETLQTPAGLFTSVEALQRFYEELARADGRGSVARPPKPGPPTTPQWARDILDRAGIGTKK